MTTIQSICEHYGIPVADTIAAFNNSGKNYEKLSGDGSFIERCRSKGIYFETVKAIIDDNVAASTGKMADCMQFDENAHRFDNFIWYDAESDLNVDDTTFILNVAASGIMGIDYTYESGDNKADIYVDGELFESPTVTLIDFSQRHALVVNNDCTVQAEIKVVFNSKEQADGFMECASAGNKKVEGEEEREWTIFIISFCVLTAHLIYAFPDLRVRRFCICRKQVSHAISHIPHTVNIWHLTWCFW